MSIRVDITQVITSLNNTQRQIDIIKRATLQEGGRFLVNEAKKNAHVVSGKMKASTGIDPGGSPDIVTVSVKVPYAKKENTRPGTKQPRRGSKPPYGPHHFFDTAVMATMVHFRSRIIANFASLFKR